MSIHKAILNKLSLNSPPPTATRKHCISVCPTTFRIDRFYPITPSIPPRPTTSSRRTLCRTLPMAQTEQHPPHKPRLAPRPLQRLPAQSLVVDIDAVHPDGASTPANGHQSPVSKPPPKRRGGFDNEQLRDLSFSSSGKSADSDQSPPFSLTPLLDYAKQLFSQQSIYDFAESMPITLFLFVTMALDFCCCVAFMSFLIHARHSASLHMIYVVVDWLTAVVYLLEVHLLFYGYGTTHYFHSIIRASEYGLSMCNTAAVIAMYLTTSPSFQIVRLLRLLRPLMTTMRWRERLIKSRTRTDLEHVANLLHHEQDVQAKLVNWKIDSDSILMGKQAGQGGFGTVYSGLFRGTLVAVKHLAFPKGAGASDQVEDEAVMLVNLRHPNVILFMGFVHEPSRLWIVTEYCSRGSLRDVLDRREGELNQARLLKIALGAARGLAYLHGQNPPVMHLDLKTSNILISAGWDAKIGDFGLSRNIDNIQNDSFSGTMQYCAPEILKSNSFSTAADVYSFGICLWEMAVGSLPFEGRSPTDVLWGVVKDALRPPVSAINISSIQKDGVESMYSVTTIEKAIAPAIRNLKEERLAAIALMRDKQGAPQMSGRESGGEWLPSRSPNDPNDKVSPPGGTHDEIKSSPPIRREKDPSVLSSRAPLTQPAQNAQVSGTTLKPPMQRLESGSTATRHSLPSDALMDHHTFNSDLSSLCNIRSVIGEQVYGNISAYMRQPLNRMPTSGTPFLGTNQFPIADDENMHPDNHSRFSKLMSTSPVTRDRLRGLSVRVSETIERLDDRPVPLRGKWRAESSDADCWSGERLKRNQLYPPKEETLSPVSPRRTYAWMHSAREPEADVSEKEVNHEEGNVSPFERRLTVFSQSSTLLERRSSGLPLRRSDLPGETSSDTNNENLNEKGVAVPQEYLDLIEDCWAQNPRERPTAGEVVWRLVMLINEGRVVK